MWNVKYGTNRSLQKELYDFWFKVEAPVSWTKSDFEQK